MAKTKSLYAQQKQYYNVKWIKWLNRKINIHEKCRKEFILWVLREMKLKSERQLKIIDLGCGAGWITSALSEYGDVTGVDLSINVAEKLYPTVKFIQANVVSLSLKDKFDIVVSSEVIEHLFQEDQSVFVRNACDLLKKKGILILTTPNKPRAEKLVFELSISRDKLQPNENWLDSASLASLLESCFKIEFMGSTMFYLNFMRRNRCIYFVYSFLYGHLRFIDRLLRTSKQGLYLTVAARKT